MPRVQAGEVKLGWREWGGGDVTVVFIHGNLASKDWIELAAPLFPSGLRVIGIDWRGCGDSDRPKPAADYSNYSMKQHAEDMLAALDALDIKFCHLATHSTGGIIAARMLLMQPQRFGCVFALDPVTMSTTVRAGWPKLLGEGVATFGLLGVVICVGRTRAAITPVAVAAYIVAAYWFTSSSIAALAAALSSAGQEKSGKP